MNLTAEQIAEIRRLFPAKFTDTILAAITDELRSRLLGVGTVLDPCAGVGGIHTLTDNLPDLYTVGVDIEEEFAACHPRTAHGDSTTLGVPGSTARNRVEKILDGRRLNAVVTSFAYGNRLCLAAGTMVITWEGPTPIEDIQPGTLVLTHRGRWRRVEWAGSTGTKPVVKVEGQGAGSLVCTADHRVWSARKHETRGIEAIDWRPAADLAPDDTRSAIRFSYWSTPSAIEACELPPCPRGADAWWFIGFWLGNGSVGKNSTTGLPSTVTVSKDTRHVERVGPALDALGAKRMPNVGRTAIWHLYDAEFAVWLRATFGRSSYTKTLPGWTLGLDHSERAALLDGWLDADGVERKDRPTSLGVSVSAALVRGMQVLASSLGRSCGYATSDAYTGTIMGADCDFAESHRLDVHRSISRKAHLADGSIWYAVRSVTPAGEAEVFDLVVEDDRSFIANGIAVHNSDSYLGSDNEKCRGKGRYGCDGGWATNSDGSRVQATIGGRGHGEQTFDQRCENCGGTGKARSKRQGYVFAKGDRLTPGSGAAVAFGRRYKMIHQRIMDGCARFADEHRDHTQPFWWVINVSSFIKDDAYVGVMEWWVGEVARHATVVELRPVDTPRHGMGANADKRVPAEHIIIARS